MRQSEFEKWLELESSSEASLILEAIRAGYNAGHAQGYLDAVKEITQERKR